MSKRWDNWGNRLFRKIVGWVCNHIFQKLWKSIVPKWLVSLFIEVKVISYGFQKNPVTSVISPQSEKNIDVKKVRRLFRKIICITFTSMNNATDQFATFFWKFSTLWFSENFRQNFGFLKKCFFWWVHYFLIIFQKSISLKVILLMSTSLSENFIF